MIRVKIVYSVHNEHCFHGVCNKIAVQILDEKQNLDGIYSHFPICGKPVDSEEDVIVARDQSGGSMLEGGVV